MLDSFRRIRIKVHVVTLRALNRVVGELVAQNLDVLFRRVKFAGQPRHLALQCLHANFDGSPRLNRLRDLHAMTGANL